MLLAHARLYCFGDQYFVEDLCYLSLYKFHDTIQRLQLQSNVLSGVLDLVRFAYQTTSLEDDPLRILMVKYLHRHIQTFGDSKELELLLMEGGDFVKDFWKASRTENTRSSRWP
jgi:hypothetical protein